MTKEEVFTRALDRMGFLQSDEVAVLAADPSTRLMWLLVRCGAGRFSCPAQDVEHFIRCIERNPLETGDYARDVSIPADTLEKIRAQYGPVVQYTAATCPGRPCGADCDHRTR